MMTAERSEHVAAGQAPAEVTDAVLREVALTRAEYELICTRLGRRPNAVELGMFGAMWSEHCGYKNSKPLLRRFPRKAPHVLVELGEENAGAVDIGDGLAIIFKIESHNHPSAVEPFQGAATGVGGIVRDIFTMGARPIALLDSLRFGPLSQPRNAYLFHGVVGGISHYGNCIGVPTVGGEVLFSPRYSSNPLVNAMCVGLIEQRKLVRARAAGEGNVVMLVGADTGRDGIHGATFASVEDPEQSHRGVVQVGNPFLEKLLIEACLELLETDYVVAMQDLGAAGLTSASVETASKGGAGIEIDVSRVSRREQGMTPYEVMLSESQERMLVIVRKGCEDKVRAIFERWGLHSDVIGRVTADGMVRVKDSERIVAEVPARFFTEPPEYVREGRLDPAVARLQRWMPDSLPLPGDYGGVLLRLLAWPDIASKEAVFRQYDYTVQTNTVLGPGGDAAVLRIKGTNKAIALSTDGNGRYCYLDPLTGGMAAVAEAARNVVCVGARPLAITDCLNFGNPEKPEVYYQLQQCIEGMSRACEALGTPVVSGNVSLYNETRDVAVYPTPIVGMLGLLDDRSRRCDHAFKNEGDVVYLLGETREELGGTAYLEAIHGLVAGLPPQVDLGRERAVQQCCLEAIRRGLLRSAHDCSDGGLAVALAESCIAGGVGARITLPEVWAGLRPDAVLFGESQSRIVVSVAPDRAAELEALAARHGVPCYRLGTVGGTALEISGLLAVDVPVLEEHWRTGLTLAQAEAEPA